MQTEQQTEHMTAQNLQPEAETDFRVYLQQELIARIQRNPRYSLRAFAKALSTNSGTLSRLLNGTRKLTPALIQDYAQKLELPPEKILFFIRAAEKSKTPEPQIFSQMAMDHFHLIADWYHYAILELTRIRSFEPNLNLISKQLGIPVVEVQAAVERLIRLGYLDTKDGIWIDRSGMIASFGPEVTSAAHRKLQRQVLEKAIEALEITPYERREQTSLTTAIDSKQLPKLKEMIRRFNEELAVFAASSKNHDSVYHCSVSLYPVAR